MSDEKSIFSNPDTFHEALNKIKNDPEVSLAPNPETIPNDIMVANESEAAPVAQSDPDQVSEEGEQQESAEKPEKSHLIPKSRFNEVVSKQKAAEEELARTRDDKVRLETQLQMFTEMQKAQQQIYQEPEPEIDPLDTDTYNYAKKEIHDLRSEMKTMAKQMADQQVQNQMYNVASAQENNFSKDHPDFRDAIEYVRNVEINIAKSLIPNEQQALAMVDQKLRDTIAISINNGKNAAETMYNIAKTYGYAGNKAQAKTPQTGANLDAISKNMNNSRSISEVGNSANFSNPVPNDIMAALNKTGNMTSGVDADKFHAMIKKLS